MKKKKISAASIKNLLIMYLAISKIHYWIEVVREMIEQDIAMSSMEVLNRATNRELPIIMVAICFIIMDSAKGKLYVKLILGYLITVGAYTAYLFTARFILGLFFTVTNPNWWIVYLNFTISFFVVGIALNVKRHVKGRFMQKEDEGDLAQ